MTLVLRILVFAPPPFICLHPPVERAKITLSYHGQPGTKVAPRICYKVKERTVNIYRVERVFRIGRT